MSESVPQQWVEQAQYDLDTARAMLDSGRYLYVLFCCQQAVEKMIKAIIAERTGQMPPRLHNLTTLAEAAKIDVGPTRALLLKDLSRYYVESRYPDAIARISRGLNQDQARRVLQHAEALLQWLSSIL